MWEYMFTMEQDLHVVHWNKQKNIQGKQQGVCLRAFKKCIEERQSGIEISFMSSLEKRLALAKGHINDDGQGCK